MSVQSATQQVNIIKRHPIPSFFIITYAFSWAIGSLLVADQQGLVSVPKALHYVSAFGPAVAAIIVTALISGRAGLADLWQRIIRVQVGWRWWLIGVGTPLGLALIAILIHIVNQGTMPDLNLFGNVDYLGNIGVFAALALWIATYGFGEEIGWRGFAFHRMSDGGWVKAAVLIGVLWGAWHLPYFFYKDNFIALGVGGFFGYVVSITMGSILMAWIYKGSNQSILLVALWHGLFDFVSASPVADGASNAVISGIVIVWVIIILRQTARTRAIATAS